MIVHYCDICMKPIKDLDPLKYAIAERHGYDSNGEPIYKVLELCTACEKVLAEFIRKEREDARNLQMRESG